MSLWTKDQPPVFHNPKHGEAVQTKAGWVDPVTGEVLVAISDLTTKSGPANVSTTRFEQGSYAQGAALKVFVNFVEKVDVLAGATIEVSTTGGGGNFLLTSAGQVGVYGAEFNGLVPAETGILSIGAQSILGTVTDTLGGAPATLAISASAGASAGVRPVA